MMKSCIINQESRDVKHFREILSGIPQDEITTAVIGRDSERWSSAVEAAEKEGHRVVRLEEGLKIHEYKRLLNECHADCLIYSKEYEELAYHVENDGTTFVQTLIPLDEITEGDQNER